MTRPGLSKRVLVVAGAVLADESGFDQVTLSAVARRLHVQAASLYNHVRDRAELLDGIHELALEELADRVGEAVAGRAGADALVGLAEAQRRFARDCPGRWTALQQPAAPSTAASPAAARAAALTMAVLRGYGLPETELVHVTRFLGATVNGFLALERSGAFAHRAPPTEESWHRALDALDVLIRSWPIPPDEGTPR